MWGLCILYAGILRWDIYDHAGDSDANDTRSCCKPQITRACRCRISQGNGSTCPRAHTRSSLISAKVRTRYVPPPFSPLLASICRTHDIVRLSLYVLASVGCGGKKLRQCPPRARVVFPNLCGGDGNRWTTFVHRTGDGYAGPRARNVAPGAGSGCWYLAAVFDPILSEHRARLAAQRACATVCVLPPLPRTFTHCLVHAWDLVPPEVLELKERRGLLGQIDCESGLSGTLA